MNSTTDPGFLSEGELPVLRRFLTFQQAFGPGMRPLAPSDWKNYCDSLAGLDGAYPQVENLVFKDWLDTLFEAVVKTTSDSVPGLTVTFPQLYIVYAYARACDVNIYAGPASQHFPVRLSTWKADMWVPFTTGYPAIASWIGPWQGNPANNGGYVLFRADCTNYKDNHVPRRPGSPAWKAATDDILQTWGDNPPAPLISRPSGPTVRSDAFNMAFSWAMPKTGYVDEDGAHTTYDQDAAWTDGAAAVAFENNILNNWSDFPDVQTTTAGVWQAQLDQANAWLAEPDLSAETYLSLLHLLIALPTGGAAGQRLAEAIAGAPAPSTTYPNDIFANQLAYLIAMTLSDPLGDRAWPASKVAQFVSDLRGVVTGADPSSGLIASALDRQAKLLKVAGYPLQDPYAAGTFDTRQTDTLGALDAARAKIKATQGS